MAAQPLRSAWLRYGVAVISVAAMALIRALVNPILGLSHPFDTFYVAIAIATWFGGPGPGILAVALGVIVGDYFFVAPVFTLVMLDSHDVFVRSGNTTYAVVGLVICGAVATLRRAWRQARTASAALRVVQDHLTAVLESTADGLLVLDDSGRVTFVNTAAKSMMAEHDFNGGTLVGRQIFDAFPDLRDDAWGKAFAQAVSQHRSVKIEYFYSPWRRWFLNRFYPTQDGSVSIFFQDITEAKYARRQLEIQHAVTFAIAHADSLELAAPEILKGICEATGSEVATLWRFDAGTNRLCCVEQYASEPDRFRSFMNETCQCTVARGVGLAGRAWAAGKPIWVADVTKDDNSRQAEVAQRQGLHSAFAAPIVLGDRFFGVIEFVTRQMAEPDEAFLQMIGSISLQIAQFIDRKEAENTLRESEKRFHLIADACPALIWVAGADMGRTWLNRAWLEFVGAEMNAEVGSGWTQHVHPDDVALCVQSYGAALNARQPWEMEYRLRRHDGVYRWVHARALHVSIPSVANDSIGCCIDVTETRLKTEELEHLVEQRTGELRESSAELEDLSYSIIHDLRAPLRAMQTWCQYLADEYASKIAPQGNEYIQRIISSSDRMDKLVRDVLAYSSVLRSKLKLEPVDPDKLVRDILGSYPHFGSWEADIKIEGVLPLVIGNEAALTQCFSHLLRNAIKFVGPGVYPRIRIGAEVLASEDACGTPSSTQEWVRLWVKDNGVGIQLEHQKIIFQLFQRLGKRSRGTGIGLAIVRKAADRMGGKVGLESEPGQGSRFWIELPSAAADSSRRERALALSALNTCEVSQRAEDTQQKLVTVDQKMGSFCEPAELRLNADEC